jgi:transglutaminase-like putative cysteine protease
MVQRTVARRIKAVYRGEYHLTTGTPVRWTMTTHLAPELPSQTGVRTAMIPEAQVVRERDGEGRLLLVGTLTSSAVTQPIAITYEATLWSRRLTTAPAGSRPSPVPTLNEPQRNYYLAAGRFLDFNAAEFQSWLDNYQLRRGTTENEVDFGRRVFAAVVQQFDTQYSPVGTPMEPVSKGCRRTAADCKLRASVFTSAMRAAGIPTRLLEGIVAKTARPETTGLIEGEIKAHVRCEFFAENVGWVPVDVNYAIADPRGPMPHYGEDPGDLLVQNVDTDFYVPNSNGLAYDFARPAGGVSGKDVGHLDYRAISWDVETLPMSAQAAAAVEPQALPQIVSADALYVRKPALPAAQPGGSTRPATSPQAPASSGSDFNVDFKPLGNDRYHIEVRFTDETGHTQTGQLDGTREEIVAWAATLTWLPADKRERVAHVFDASDRLRQMRGRLQNAPSIDQRRPAPGPRNTGTGAPNAGVAPAGGSK